MKKIFAFTLALMMVLSLAACGSAASGASASAGGSGSSSGGDETVTLTLAHIRPVGSSADLAIHDFADEATSLSNGSLQFDIYPAAQLGDYTTVQERVSIGDVDMQIASLGSNMDKVFALSNAAYLCTDWDTAKEMFGDGSALIKIYQDKLADYNMTYLCSYPLYFGGIALNVEPKDPTNPDAKSGIKIRVPSMTTFEKTAENLGYLATPLASTEMFTAIQTGVVNGAIGAGAEMYYGNLSGLVKYYLPINDHFEQWYMYINTDKWNTLSENQQNALKTAAQNMQEKRWEVAPDETAEYEQKLADSGTTIIQYTDEQIQAFADKVRKNVWPVIEEEYGKENFEAVVNSVK